jgi:hypothetical protein
MIWRRSFAGVGEHGTPTKVPRNLGGLDASPKSTQEGTWVTQYPRPEAAALRVPGKAKEERCRGTAGRRQRSEAGGASRSRSRP